MISKEQLKAKLERNKIQELQGSNRNPYPSTLKMAKNLGSSIVRNIQSVAAGNDLRLSEDDANRRLAICQQCEFFREDQKRCGKCGCFMSVKTYLKAERCPIGKW